MREPGFWDDLGVDLARCVVWLLMLVAILGAFAGIAYLCSVAAEAIG